MTQEAEEERMFVIFKLTQQPQHDHEYRMNG